MRGVLCAAAGAVSSAGLAMLRFAVLPGMAMLAYAGGVWALWQYAGLHAVQPADPQTDAAACPWLAPADVAAINGAARIGEGVTLYDRDLCRTAAGRYQANPWIQRVVAVRRVFPDRVVVDLAIRRPFACVRNGGSYHVVDRFGCRLPMQPGRRNEFPCVAIEGIREQPPPVGGDWAGRQMGDALRLAELLMHELGNRGRGLRLDSVEVCAAESALDGLPEFQARTESGMLIDWGSLNDIGGELLPSVEEKRRELARVLDRVDDPNRVETIMVRYRGHSLYLRDSFDGAGGRLGAADASGRGP